MNKENKFELLVTEDGSQTFVNKDFGEAYHSCHGAYTEALEKHVRASKILDFAKEIEAVKILDVCFGFGYNSFVAAIELAKLDSKPSSVSFVCLENDIQTLNKIHSLDFGLQDKQALKDFVALFIGQMPELLQAKDFSLAFNYQGMAVSFDFLIGDAREKVKNLQPDFFHAIFFDPFSPKTCPELWEAKFIDQCINSLKPNFYSTTYSSSRIAKDNFAAAGKFGCRLEQGPKLQRRTGGVLARKNPVQDSYIKD